MHKTTAMYDNINYFQLVCAFIGGCGFDFLPSDAFMKFLAQFLCGQGGFKDIICENVMFLLCGYDYAQLNKVRHYNFHVTSLDDFSFLQHKVFY